MDFKYSLLQGTFNEGLYSDELSDRKGCFYLEQDNLLEFLLKTVKSDSNGKVIVAPIFFLS